MMGHLLVYIMVSIFVTISYSPPQLPVYFVAPGASTTLGPLASHPLGSFWNLQLEESALWNRLQHIWDRHHNPILRGNSTAGGITRLERDVSSECGTDQCWLSFHPNFNALSEKMRAFIKAMHRREYPFYINPPRVCVGNKDTETETPMLIMAIKSQVGNFENRQAIRDTWGRSGWVRGEQGGGVGLVRTVFLLGRQDPTIGPHPDLGGLLMLESQKHGDILQWNFKDTFFNLTMKDLLFWQWLQNHCPGAQFVFKGDDDVFVRTGALLDYLHKQKEEAAMWRTDRNNTDQIEDFIVGDVILNAMPNRQPNTKYYIPESFYKGAYPPYAGGGGVVYSGALAMRLRQVSERVRLFPIDDVYLGMCLHRLGIAPIHHPGFYTFDLPETEREKSCAYSSVLLVHKRSPKEMLQLWKQLQDPPSPC
ncbi:hypothetical protein DPEC_G00240380 [Dallia pectoralis]|uniref:Uncharacterized protein n=1 Tax=Dallia pectoralis TaxID=75939 RepID=A0ACC2FZJ0_DALPE|nr:hypothetical protein DPEC_G00240380 [Dallia pectoralis]